MRKIISKKRKKTKILLGPLEYFFPFKNILPRQIYLGKIF